MARDPDAVRITTASTSRNAEIAARQRRYIWSMGVRTVCFVAAIAVGPGWLRWVLVAGAVLLPYVAVVMANAAPSKADGFALTDGVSGTPQLESGQPESGRGSDEFRPPQNS
jgi:hypothetical protein